MRFFLYMYIFLSVAEAGEEEFVRRLKSDALRGNLCVLRVTNQPSRVVGAGEGEGAVVETLIPPLWESAGSARCFTATTVGIMRAVRMERECDKRRREWVGVRTNCVIRV